MNITEFKASLASRGQTVGGSFVKADFHVHAPGPGDYSYKQPDAAEKLGRALREGSYGYAIVLQHNEVPTPELIASLQKHCPDTTLIPGAEVNVHVDALFKKVEKNLFCHCILAADPAVQDRGTRYIFERAKEKFRSASKNGISGFTSSVEDLGRFFLDKGALFIPAHLHQAKDPTKSRSLDDIYDDDTFLGFLERKCFSAIEVTNPKTAAFFDGSKNTEEDIAIPEFTCVSSSDAHHHDHIPERNRATWVQTENRSFEELRAALSFPHRVRLSAPSTAYDHVVGLHVVGKFIPDEWFHLNPQMNCLIGSKGSGKTSVLECLRFVLEAPCPKKKRDSIKKHVDHILGSGGLVECLIRKTDGTEFLLQRRADSPDRLSVTSEDGTSQQIPSIATLGLHVSVLGWHEIEAIAEDPTERVRLIDQIGKLSEITTEEKKVSDGVNSARDSFPEFQTKLRQLQRKLRALWELKRKRGTLTKLEQTDVVTLETQYQQLTDAESKLTALAKSLTSSGSNYTSRVQGEFSFLESPIAADSSALPELRSVVDSVSTYVESVSTAVRDSSSSLVVACQEAAENVAKSQAELRSAFDRFRKQTYEPALDALSPEAREVLTKRIQVIEETKQLPELEAECEELRLSVCSLAQNLEDHCSSVCTARDELCKLREEAVSLVNEEISSVRVEFKRRGNNKNLGEFQRTHGEKGSQLFQFVTQHDGEETYERLKKLFANLTTLSLAEDKWAVSKLLDEGLWVHFLDVVDQDDVLISLVVGDAGPVPLNNLSAGQKSTAIFPLLLRDTRGPLIIDQPEDNLDNRYIARDIAPDLVRKKREQQFLFTSHNANLVVLTDADLIVHMDSNGKTARVETRGFFSCSTSSVRDSVLEVLDGGTEALESRQNKYRRA